MDNFINNELKDIADAIRITAEEKGYSFKNDDLGATDGTTTVFTLLYKPIGDVILSYKDATSSKLVTEPFVVSGKTVTFATAPAAGSELFAFYLYRIIPGAAGQYFDEFIQMIDTPNNYTGSSAKVVAVKSDESGLEFIPQSTSTEQEVITSLAANASHTMVHSSDANFKRLVQVFYDRLYTATNFDFNTLSEWFLEDSNKIIVDSGVVMLTGLTGLNAINYWQFSEGSGTLVADYLGNNNGAFTNPAWDTGIMDSSGKFESSNNYVNVGNAMRFSNTQSFTIEFWMNNASTDTQHIIGAENGDVSTKVGLWLFAKNGNSYLVRFSHSWTSNAIALDFTGVPQVSDGNWHHYVLTYDGSSDQSGFKLYVDTLEITARNVIYNSLSLAPVVTRGMYIGSRGGIDYPNLGLIDEFVVYESVIPYQHIVNRYNGGAGTKSFAGGYDDTQYWYAYSLASQIDTAAWGTLENLTITETTPANTYTRYLISTNNKLTWQYWDGSAWQTTTLANIGTDGNTKAEIEALTDVEYAPILATTLDIAIGLRTTDNSATPTVDQITAYYTVPGKNLAGDQAVSVKLLSPTETEITNTSGIELTDVRINVLA